MPTQLRPLRVPKKHLGTFLAFVGDGAGTSVRLSEWLARIQEINPTPERHEVIMRILEDLIRRDLVTGRAGVANGRVQIYIDLALTERGRTFLERSKHRFWFIPAAYEEIKEFAAMVVAFFLKP